MRVQLIVMALAPVLGMAVHTDPPKRNVQIRWDPYYCYATYIYISQWLQIMKRLINNFDAKSITLYNITIS